MIIYQYTTRKQLAKDQGAHILGSHEIDPRGNHLITLCYHASTATKCHETAHAYNDDNPNDPDKKLSEIFSEEVAAEVASYRWRNKKLGARILNPALNRLFDFCGLNLIRFLGNTTVFNMCLNTLEEYEVSITQGERSNIWRNLVEWSKVKDPTKG